MQILPWRFTITAALPFRYLDAGYGVWRIARNRTCLFSQRTALVLPASAVRISIENVISPRIDSDVAPEALCLRTNFLLDAIHD